MPLQLVLGPANCGKIALLLDRFLAAADADEDPFLIVPNRPDVEALERELVRRRGVLVGGRIGTFDDLFEEVLGRCRELRPLVGEVQRRLLLAAVVADTPLAALEASARFGGFEDAVGALADELLRRHGRSAARRRVGSGRGSSRRSSPPTGPRSTRPGRTTARAGVRSPPACSRAAWMRGTSAPCSPTASRT